MTKKWGILVFILLLIFATPTFGAVKVNWTTNVSGSNSPANTGIYGNSGFETVGDWALSQELTFFLRNQLTINTLTKDWNGSLDRCYLRYESGAFRLNLGRQTMGWGIGWFFRPTDLITPISPLAKEDSRPGKDLAVLRWSTSPVTAIDIIVGDRLAAARGEWRYGKTNIRLSGVTQSQTETVNNLGWDAQGGLAGLYTEGKYAWTDQMENGKLTALLGWRKTVWSNRQLFVEYLRDNSGEVDPKHYNYELITTGKRTFLGQSYLATGLQIPWDELTTFSLTGVSNLNDGSIMLTGITDWQLSDNLDLRGMVATLIGDDGKEFITIAGGARWNVMVQLKYYF